MQRKLFILIFLIFNLLINTKFLLANDKSKIIKNLNNIETLEFQFTQTSLDKEENGICFLKRPYFLKCLYNDKIKKVLIINRKNLVIYQKKYNKTYYYPVSRSYFVDLLDKKKFENLILNANLILDNDVLKVNYFEEKKGKVTFFFKKENFDLFGWEIIDLSNNRTNFKIYNIVKNQNFENKIFSIPETN